MGAAGPCADLGAYSPRFSRQEQHRSLSRKSQVLTAPSRMHDSGGRVRVLAEQQVTQFMRHDTAQNHFELPEIRKFPSAVRIDIGHNPKSFVLG
jgi:hypothetical protein